MAFITRLTRPTIVAATLAAGTVAYSTSTPLLAEDSLPRTPRYTSVRPGRSSSGEKLPIYPSPDFDAPVTLIEVAHPLSPHIAKARIATSEVLSGAGEYVQAGVSRWIKFERAVEREVKSILPKDEALTPGIIYVLIAGLSGSVLTRTRAFPLRLLTPPLFALTAMPFFLPHTSHNLRQYLAKVEDSHFPEFASQHDQINHTVSSHWNAVKSRVGGAGEEAQGWAQKAVEGVENRTGLRVGDVVRRGKERVEEEKEKLNGGLKAAEGQKMEVVGYVVEERPVAEIVAPIGGTHLSKEGRRAV